MEYTVCDSERIEVLSRGDEEAAAELMARAFRDSPLHQAVAGDDPARRLQSSRHGMRAALASSREHGDRRALWLDEGAGPRLVAILVGFDPGVDSSSPAPRLVQLRCLLGQGLRTMRRWAVAHQALAASHPAERHAHLGLLAVEPDMQRRGLGAQLLADWLAGVDAHASAGYLETDRESLLGFYSRFGFEVRERVNVLGVPVWCCQRAARRIAEVGGDPIERVGEGPVVRLEVQDRKEAAGGER